MIYSVGALPGSGGSMSSRGSNASDRAGFNRHRFDNYGAWLDREDRLKAQAKGKLPPWGYSSPKQPAPPRVERPFEVQEYTFTGAVLVTREYEQIQSSFKCEANRSDAHHYPNYMGVQDATHYADHRRRSCNPDSSRWTPLPGDKVLADAVSDEAVRCKVRQEKGETRVNIPPELLALQQGNPQLSRHAVQELRKEPERVDMSCMELPPQVTAVRTPGRSDAGGSPNLSKTNWAMSGNNAPPPPPPEPPEGGRGMPPSTEKKGPKWQWCIGGKPPPESQAQSPEIQNMIRTNSLPLMLPGHSFLIGNIGGESSAFHGVPRSFGGAKFDGRMRGGLLARNGFAGTFPKTGTFG